MKSKTGILLLIVGVVWNTGSKGDEPAAGARFVPKVESFLVIPLRLHVLKSKDLPEIDCQLTDVDLERIAVKLNGIWNKAGIHWGVESIVREPASESEKFRLAGELDSPRSLAAYRWLLPEESRRFAGLHVYYLHEFSVNGVWLGDDYALVKETAQLRSVEGGIDEPIPRVTAHELGHILGLPHRQARTNLLQSGTAGTLLNDQEIETARAKALKVGGVLTFETLKASANREPEGPDAATRTLHRRWLAEIQHSEMD